MKKIFFTGIASFLMVLLFAQPDRWQQRISYNMDVNLDVKTNILNGTQQIEYWNNSPDTLYKLFFHAYWNAFQPNSSMDVRSRELGKTVLPNGRPDWDGRVTDRISKLQPDEIGYQKIKTITVNGKAQKQIDHETIIEIVLDKPLLPKSKTLIKTAFEAQVPKQIRRSGRDNAEGVRYTMTQWFPKLAEYDYQGWNANPYIAREFYGVWGDFDVKITLDKTYMVASTGELQNADKIGFGYSNAKPVIKGNTLTWNFIGKNIHDFAWSADPNYKHISKEVRKGLTLRVFYLANNEAEENAWKNVLWSAEKVLPYIEKRFGKYPWPVYSFVQGGDGGMEYAMLTMLKGSGIGTVVHEWMHSWYQQLLGTNESLYPWMDEGFTDYAENETMGFLYQNYANQSPYITDKQKKTNEEEAENYAQGFPENQSGSYATYFDIATSPLAEPLSTHADHYNTNKAYGQNSYTKGSVFLNQLGYIVGDSVLNKILLTYYNEWKFKHPNPNDFIRIAEKVSGMQLQWYKEYWINTTKTIDYAVGDMKYANGKTQITIKRIGKMPMPVDVLLTFKDGTKEFHNIPSSLMFGNKKAEYKLPYFVQQEWKWTHPEYVLETARNLKDLKEVFIDPTGRLADINYKNNVLEIPD